MATGIVTDYKIGLKEGLEAALRGIFGSNYPDPQLRNKVHVSLDFPQEEATYPAIYITYSEGPIENVGVGHSEISVDASTGSPQVVRHYRFSGQVNFNVLGRTPLERDMVTAGLLNVIAFGRDNPIFQPYYDALYDNKFVHLQVNTDQIVPGGENVTNVPWDSEGDERLYANQYRVAVVGEFWNDPVTGGLIQISTVDLYPYRGLEGQLPPSWAV
jgi:hypothetical protein